MLSKEAVTSCANAASRFSVSGGRGPTVRADEEHPPRAVLHDDRDRDSCHIPEARRHFGIRLRSVVVDSKRPATAKDPVGKRVDFEDDAHAGSRGAIGRGQHEELSGADELGQSHRQSMNLSRGFANDHGDDIYFCTRACDQVRDVTQSAFLLDEAPDLFALTSRSEQARVLFRADAVLLSAIRIGAHAREIQALWAVRYRSTARTRRWSAPSDVMDSLRNTAVTCFSTAALLMSSARAIP